MTRFNYTKTSRKTVTITAAPASAARIAVPEKIEGFPVDEISPHAFSGLPEVLEISLPESIRTVGNYAFYNCRRLRSLFLTDSIEEFGDGAVRLCPSLHHIEFRINKDHYRPVKDLLADTDAELRVDLVMNDGTARLVFPGFTQEYREDTRARAFHQSIHGNGYSYRVCVTRSGVDYEGYDACFERGGLAVETAAADIALARLMYPRQLSPEAESRYASYLEEHAPDILSDLIRREDEEGVGFLLGKTGISKAALDEGIRIASEKNLTVITGLLMEALRERFGSGLHAEIFSF